MSRQLDLIAGDYLPAVDREIRAVLRADGDDYARTGQLFWPMIHYHMGWVTADLQPDSASSGKRIRPLLCLLSCDVAGGDWEQAVPAGAAVEILHNFSLVHDDIQDESPTRRGRATLWTIWGTAQAINTGDAMFALSHLALNRLSLRGVDPSITVRALRRFDETSVALTQGQHVDMNFETRSGVSVDEYLAMITGKTAVLLAHCAELGAMVAGADDRRIEHFAAFGRELGLAFQIQDDILGIWGDEALTGKSAATDIVTRKKSLPVLYGLAQSPGLKALYAGETGGEDFVVEVVAALEELGGRDFAQEQATLHSDRALEHLAAANPAGPAAEALYELAHMLLQRQH